MQILTSGLSWWLLETYTDPGRCQVNWISVGEQRTHEIQTYSIGALLSFI
jgi:hypothetical protein